MTQIRVNTDGLGCIPDGTVADHFRTINRLAASAVDNNSAYLELGAYVNKADRQAKLAAKLCQHANQVAWQCVRSYAADAKHEVDADRQLAREVHIFEASA